MLVIKQNSVYIFSGIRECRCQRNVSSPGDIKVLWAFSVHLHSVSDDEILTHIDSCQSWLRLRMELFLNMAPFKRYPGMVGHPTNCLCLNRFHHNWQMNHIHCSSKHRSAWSMEWCSLFQPRGSSDVVHVSKVVHLKQLVALAPKWPKCFHDVVELYPLFGGLHATSRGACLKGRHRFV